MEQDAPTISPSRLRLGVLFVALWWIPVWALAPVIAGFWDLDGRTVVIVMAVIQTVIGLLGVLIAGRQDYRIMQGVPRKQLLPTVWGVLRRGTLEDG
jgi:hypothetical protein